MLHQVPEVGDTVLYHHVDDARDWPAMILDVSGGPTTETDSGDAIESTGDAPPEPYALYVQVFRPRGNDWKRTSLGDSPGQCSLKLPPVVHYPPGYFTELAAEIEHTDATAESN